jgi:hypothetical protein
MTGGNERDEFQRTASEADSEGLDQDDFVLLERAMSPLLDAVRTFAREEEAEIGTYAANTSHLISDVAQEDIVQKILALQARERADTPEEQGHARRMTSELVGLELPRRSHRRRTALAFGGGLVATALAVALWMRPTPQGPALPAYSIEARGGIKDARGGAPDEAATARTTAPAQRLNLDSQLVVALRPETAVSGDVAARAFIVHGGDTTEVAPRVQVAPTGAIELRFHGSELIGSRHGEASLRVIVGRPAAVRTLVPSGLPLARPQVATARLQTLTVPLQLP